MKVQVHGAKNKNYFEDFVRKSLKMGDVEVKE